MTLQPSQRNRAHNLRIVGTIQTETEHLNLDWQALESKLLAAVAYAASRQILYLRFQSGEVYRYFLSLAINTTNSSPPNPEAVTSSPTSAIGSPTNASPTAELLGHRSRRFRPGRLQSTRTSQRSAAGDE